MIITLFIKLKKNAYKKYVEECWGAWVEKDQQKYFENFINQVRENAYIIQYDNKYIGFYNGKNINQIIFLSLLRQKLLKQTERYTDERNRAS